MKTNAWIDYVTGALLILILLLGSYLAPNIYSNFTDSRDMNEAHIVEREAFYFGEPIKLNVEERVQNMMAALSNTTSLQKPVAFSDTGFDSAEFLLGIKEAIGIAISCRLLPDISNYEIERYIVYVEYYNVTDGVSDSSEASFFRIRFSDYKTFDFTLCIDASEFIIYQAEVYCAEVSEYVEQITSDDKEVVEFLNNQFVENAAVYFEAEGYDVLTNILNDETVAMFGYERGEYALYHNVCNYGSLESYGIRWGFVPMVRAMAGQEASKEWDNKKIEEYFRDKYNITVIDEYPTE